MLRGHARDARDGRRGLTCLHVNRRDGDQSTRIPCGSHAGIMTVQYEPMHSSLSYTGHDLSLQAVRSHDVAAFPGMTWVKLASAMRD